MNINNRNYLLQSVFIILFLLPILYPVNWTGNEFNYFGIAKHNIDPNPYSQFYAAFNGQLSRFSSDYTMGTFVKHFGFDDSWVILRIFGIIGLSLSLALLTTILEIPLVPSILALIAFKKLGQTYFGGEWLFDGIEPKIFAYVFVFLGLAYAIKDKLPASVVFLSLATYFHFLVGGFWGIAIFVYIYLSNGLNKIVIINFIFFVISIIPLLILLVYDNLRLPASDTTDFGYTIDQVYSNIRAPHHVAPFDGNKIRSNWRMGFVLIIFNTAILYFLYYKNLIKSKSFVLWVILLHFYLFVAFFVAFFDRETQYLGKFYLFRPASFILLLSLLICCNFVFGYLNKLKIPPSVFTAVLIFIVLRSVYINMSVSHFKDSKTLYDSLSQDEKILINWLKTKTSASDIMLYEEDDIGKLNAESFEQLVDKPTLVNWKFVPTTKYSIARWYRLMLLKRQAYSGVCLAFNQLPARYYIAYSISGRENISHCAEPVFSIGKYRVFYFPAKPV